MIGVVLEQLQFFWFWLLSDWRADSSVMRGLVSPLFVAGFAAYFGAHVASIRASKSEQLRSDLRELEATYNAAALASIACKSLLSMKRQHIKELQSDFYTNRAMLEAELDREVDGGRVIAVPIDLMKITSPKFESQRLFEAMGIVRKRDPNDTVQAAALVSCTDNIENLLSERNKWIDGFKASPDSSGWSGIATVFGFPISERSIDNTYRSFVDHLALSVDDGIFHSYCLYSRLIRQVFAKRYDLPRKLQKDFQIQIAVLHDGGDSELFPNVEDYQDWLQVPAKTKVRPFWKSKKVINKAILDKNVPIL